MPFYFCFGEHIRKFALLCAFVGLFASAQASSKQSNTMTVTVGIYNGFENVVGDLKPEKVCIENNVPLNQRTLADLVLLCKAFASQGVQLKVDLKFFPNNRRSMKMVESGEVSTLVPSSWHSSLNMEKVAASMEVIKKGQFEKGIYVHESHPLLNKKRSEIDFSHYIGASVKNWRLDWAQMVQLTPNQVDIGHLPALYAMLASGRADFTFLEFTPNKDFASTNAKGIRLLPIKGIKIKLADSRHFAVSRRFKESQRYLTLLNKGLAVIMSSGEVEAIYRKAGLINDKTRDWAVLNQSRYAQ